MFASSTQKRYWIFANEFELERKRRKCNKKFISKFRGTKSDAEVESYFLTYEEERRVLETYEIILKEFCAQFQPKLPANVVGTVYHYFKRFYLNNSVMDRHPKEILITCAYLACKTEEFNVTMPQFLANTREDEDREKIQETILNNELLIMEAFKFHLTIFNPYVPVDGFIDHIRCKADELNIRIDANVLRPYVDQFLEIVLLTDVPLLFTPVQIALAAILQGASKTGTMLDKYVQQFLVENDEQLLKLTGYIKKIRRIVATKVKMGKQGLSPINDLEKKLSICRNQENNPYSEMYKNKMLEDLNDDDD